MVEINNELASRLIKSQFPQWADLPIKPVVKGGNDNRTFHLGAEMSMRLPSHERYVAQVEKEQLWLPKLRAYLTLSIPDPVAQGKPGEGYPWPWTVNNWIAGSTLNDGPSLYQEQLAIDLAEFLQQLQAIDPSGGPYAGTHNFYRGGSLSVYHDETVIALEQLQLAMDKDKLREIWETALQSTWQTSPVWVHGDVAPGNLLAVDGRLCGVIDFGMLGVGDPACDMTMAWTFFDTEGRRAFVSRMACEEAAWNRARGWALWKALITYNGNSNDSVVAAEARRVFDVILGEYAESK